jgi:subtilisin family serine protease
MTFLHRNSRQLTKPSEGTTARKRWISVAACLTFIAVAGDARVRTKPEPVPDQYIVVLDDSAVPRSAVAATAMAMALQHRGRLLGSFSNGVRGFGIEMPSAEAEALSNNPQVAWVEQNAVVHFSYQAEYYSDDTFWHLDRIDQRTTINPFMTKAYAWTSTGFGVAVYVIDRGVEANHSEFNGNVVGGGNFAVEDGYPPEHPCGGFVNAFNPGHGTAVASVIAGQHVGVARDATIVAVKVGPCHPNEPPSYGPPAAQLSIVQSLDWVLDDMAKPEHHDRRAVVNMSLYTLAGQSCAGYDCASSLDYNVRYVINAGAVVVASANNQYLDQCTVQSPARLGYGGMYDPGNQPTWPFVITVGGTDISDNRYFCNSCTSDPGSNVGACVDIYAPAKNIHAAHIAAANAYRDDPYWVNNWNQQLHDFYGDDSHAVTVEAVASGTSFSAPIVAGIAARLLQTFPSMSVRDVWNYIHDSATALPANFDGDGKADNDRLAYISPYN